MSVSDREARAEARKRRAVLRKTSLTDRAPGDDLDPVRGAEAVSLAHQLSRECWGLAGNDVPSYPREQTPCRFVPGSKG